MTDQQNNPTPEELAAAEAAKAEKLAAAEAAKAAKAGKTKAEWPKFMKSLTRFHYTDPVTKIRFSATAPVRIDAAPEVGSWLHCQMQAGYIGEA